MVMQDFQAECLSLGSVFSPVTVSATVTPTPSSTSAAPPRPKANSTSTGAVAGGVVGGIVAIAIIACCVLIILRRRRRAMIPDANSPTTMTYSVPVASPLSAAPRPDMLRYRSLNNPSNEYSIPATSPLPAASQHRDLNSNSSSTEYGETADTSSLPATIMLSPDPRRSRQHVTYLTKEREAFRRSAVNHTDVGSSNASSTQAGDSTVLVHKDGGRVQREIPPTYDSIEDF
ncbi:hypothetical protein C8J56DRAFT_893927 [Mycena floridula]|nr:hypothetical protein C8J56DRAFT_893927 [Mycena floridula]